ncbi:MAG: hypothetical protein DRI36_04700, partial [Caldiserica bacterium]
VWDVVRKIPFGETRTYKWVAKKLGNLKLVRFVGLALNKNPFAPVVPCHRVIKSDGTIGGYSRGIDKKIELLKSEGIRIFEIDGKILVERKGVVKYWNEIRGEGRIKPIDEDGEFIFNFKDIEGDGYRTVDEGEIVYFLHYGKKVMRVRKYEKEQVIS